MPRAGDRSAAIRTLQAGIFLLGAGVWELGARAGWIDTFFFSQPSVFLARVWTWLVDPRASSLGGRPLHQHILVTLEEMAGGFMLGVTFGVAAGFLLGRSDFWARVLRPYIEVANALPRLVLAPIFVLVLGLDQRSKIALGFSLVF